ncbi:isoamylase 1, chloroplastic-like [Salvia splendens]|uniref:isoamylase 1, chloroplastic-like n=1 Tax=Salvia splendens TaxID=180675 RepID=UPI001C2585EE|nr:isoamylase 1, chloroplastic-like [Salvia splendens]
MELLRSSLIPNYLAPKLTAKTYLHHRERELNFGIPNHSFSKNTGATAKRCAIVNSSIERGDADTALVVEKPPPKPRLFKVLPDRPTPFGATLRHGGVNIAKIVTEEIALNPLINKTGDVWHVFVKGDFEEMAYGYRVKGSFSP